ncbi:unnamed protein product [Rhizophagus irregularis]|nr:unnamed protein product [Rhizophagus irregularis]
MQQENSEPVFRVEKKSDGTFRRRTAQCEHHGNYVTKSNKETTTKRLGCAWHINLSEPTSKNPFKYVYITTLHDIHSYNLNPNIIQFGDNKYIPSEIMKEIEFLTIKCRMGAATQRQYLEQYLINTLYNTKESWAHPWTCHQFTAGFHASSPVESINVWIKSYIFNSNISLCELGDVIERRQIAENKKYQLVLWKAAIPCVPTQISTAAFMFTSINQKLEEYLPPAILELQRDEICQCVFYNAVQVTQEVIDEFDKYDLLLGQYLEDVSDACQITAACMISNINKDQISSIDKDLSKKQFLVASKFENEITPLIPQHNVPFLTAICKTSQEFITWHEQLTDIQLYGKIAGLSHKATMKAVSKRDILRIIHILENYLKDVDEEQDEEQNENIELEDTKDDKSDKENFPFILNNPNKQTRSKGRPKGTKRIKASHEKEKATTSVNSKQYKCGNYGDMGHNKRNCNILR